MKKIVLFTLAFAAFAGFSCAGGGNGGG